MINPVPLPYTDDFTYLVTQGFNSQPSHNQYLKWGVDFGMSYGSRVHAIMGGKIVAFRQNVAEEFIEGPADAGNPAYAGAGHGNYVTIRSSVDEQDVFVTYAHMAPDFLKNSQNILPDEGSFSENANWGNISLGEDIGLTGATGLRGTSRPESEGDGRGAHLHIHLGTDTVYFNTDAEWIANGSADSTLPVYFEPFGKDASDIPLGPSLTTYAGSDYVLFSDADDLGTDVDLNDSQSASENVSSAGQEIFGRIWSIAVDVANDVGEWFLGLLPKAAEASVIVQDDSGVIVASQTVAADTLATIDGNFAPGHYLVQLETTAVDGSATVAVAPKQASQTSSDGDSLATAINLGTVGEFQLIPGNTVSYDSDLFDYYAFTISENSDVTVAFTPDDDTNGSAHMNIVADNGNGLPDRVVTGQPLLAGSDIEIAKVDSLAAGDYFIQVVSEINGGTTPYKLIMTTEAAEGTVDPDPDPEPDPDPDPEPQPLPESVDPNAVDLGDTSSRKVRVGNGSGYEDAGTDSINLMTDGLLGPLPDPVTVVWEIISETATNGVDFLLPQYGVTVMDNWRVPIEIPLIDDSNFEGDETFEVRILRSNAEIDDDTGTFTIREDDPPPPIEPTPERMIGWFGSTYAERNEGEARVLRFETGENVPDATEVVVSLVAGNSGQSLDAGDFVEGGNGRSFVVYPNRLYDYRVELIEDELTEGTEDIVFELSTNTHGAFIDPGKDESRLVVLDTSTTPPPPIADHVGTDGNDVITVTAAQLLTGESVAGLGGWDELIIEGDVSFVLTDFALSGIEVLQLRGAGNVSLTWSDIWTVTEGDTFMIFDAADNPTTLDMEGQTPTISTDEFNRIVSLDGMTFVTSQDTPLDIQNDGVVPPFEFTGSATFSVGELDDQPIRGIGDWDELIITGNQAIDLDDLDIEGVEVFSFAGTGDVSSSLSELRAQASGDQVLVLDLYDNSGFMLNLENTATTDTYPTGDDAWSRVIETLDGFRVIMDKEANLIALNSNFVPIDEFSLVINQTENGEFGNKYNGLTDVDGVVHAGFQGQVSDLELSVVGFDIDFSDEVEVRLNGDSLGYLSVGPNNAVNSGDTFTINTISQLAGTNTLEFVQTRDINYKWGVTDILLKEAAPPEDIALTLGVAETGEFGNKYNGQTDADGVVQTSFVNTSSDLDLSVTGFDVDFADEVEVLLNDVSLGFLSTGLNNGENGGDTFTIAAGDQIAGTNIVSFVQNRDINFKWGVTDILLEESGSAPPADFALTLDVTETGEFGNKFNAANDIDGLVEGTFANTGSDLDLTLTGFDIDFADEVEVLLNGSSIGFLSQGANNGFNGGDTFSIAAGDQIAGTNTLGFSQNLDNNFKWGVTDILLEENTASPVDFTLVPGIVEAGEFGNKYNGQSEPDGVVTAGFENTGNTLDLSLTGFDVDFANEIEVLLNGVSQGFLSVGPDNAENAGDTFIIAAADQQTGTNILSFEQNLNTNYKWGVTDIVLEEVTV